MKKKDFQIKEHEDPIGSILKSSRSIYKTFDNGDLKLERDGYVD